MKNTPFYNLKQPEDNDNVLIDDLNGNFDVIDQTLHELDEEKAAKAKPKSAGNLAELTADGALQDSGRAPGKPNGVATLDGNGKIPVDQVPNKYLPLAGGTMSGTINMGRQRITNLPKPSSGSEPLRKDDGGSAETLALFGLGTDAVPDAVLQKLAGAAFDSGGTITDVNGNPLGVRIATGSYVGTGTYGSSNPNSLTFEFEPKMVIIAVEGGFLDPASSANGYRNSLFWFYGCTISQYENVNINISIKGNVFSWYSTSNQYQLNRSDLSYNYIAIG